jgi:hypothetical protein
MSDVDDFLAEIHPRLVQELQALHNGDPQPRLAMWSTEDPVTLFGAGMSGRGWDKVSGIFHTIASRWSDCTDQRVEILAAGVSGDLAYTVELEHTSVSVDGVPVEPYTPARHPGLPPRGWRVEGRPPPRRPDPVRPAPAPSRRSIAGVALRLGAG